MNKELENFLNSKGINKKTSEFSLSQETLINPVIENVLKPTLAKVADELNIYSNIKADLLISKKSFDSATENIELRIYKIMQPKFSYYPKFIVEEDKIFIIGRFSIPNLYGDIISYDNTELRKLIAEVNSEDIKNDFISVFTNHVKL